MSGRFISIISPIGQGTGEKRAINSSFSHFTLSAAHQSFSEGYESAKSERVVGAAADGELPSLICIADVFDEDQDAKHEDSGLLRNLLFKGYVFLSKHIHIIKPSQREIDFDNGEDFLSDFC